MVTLTIGIDHERLVAHQHLAMDPARNLVSAYPRIGENFTVCLPFQIETERHYVTMLTAIDLRWIVQTNSKGLEPDAHMIKRCLNRVIGPKTFCSDLVGSKAGQVDVMVEHCDQLALWADETCPIPSHPLVGIETQPDVAGDVVIWRHKVQIPALAPPKTRLWFVIALVGWAHKWIGHGLNRMGR